MNSPDWQDAKRGILPAAQKVVEQLWTPEQTVKLRTKLQPDKELAFVSVPSTSRTNKIPDALGQKLAGQLGGTYLDVNGLYKMHAEDAMKNQPKAERPFAERSYDVLDAQALAGLRDRQVVLTEDVLTTGSSARRFALELRRQGVEVQTVAGLMGDARLDAPPQLLSRLQNTLKNAGMSVKGRSLTEVLSAGEIEIIIGLINTGGPHERRVLAEKLQRLLDTRTAGTLGKHPR